MPELPRQRGGRLQSAVFDGLARAHVDQALAALDRGAQHPFGPSTDYDLVHLGRRYPPKAVFGIAAGYHLGLPLSPRDFSAGEGTPCFKLLREHGFEIRAKDLPGEDLCPIVLVNNDPATGANDYEDVVGEQYHFPNQYRGLVLPGRRFVYYRGVHKSDGSRRPKPEYFGQGVIGDVWQDFRNDPQAPKRTRQWYAAIAEYTPLDPPVPWDRDGTKLEDIASNRFAVAVRELAEGAYENITGARPPAEHRLLVTSIEKQKLTPASETLLVPKLSPNGRGSVTGSSRRSLRAKVVGDRGEKLVLRALEAETITRGWTGIRHVAAEGHTPGWDIQYHDRGELVAVEVKTTTASKFPSFDITANELRAAQEHGPRYRIALVASADSPTPRIQWIEDLAGLLAAATMLAEPTMYRLTQTR